MMKHRFNLFCAGFNAYAPTLYYRQLAFINDLEKEEDLHVKSCLPRMQEQLRQEDPRYKEYLDKAIDLAKELDLNTLPAPDSVLSYSEWLKEYVSIFEGQFPMNRIDHYYFLYSRKIAEILCNLRLIRFFAEWNLELREKVDLRRHIDKYLKDTEYILFKLVAAAALLSSEPRHNYFNVYYKAISKDYQPIKEVTIEELSPDQLKSFSDQIGSYETTVEEGFRKCLLLLEELQY